MPLINHLHTKFNMHIDSTYDLSRSNIFTISYMISELQKYTSKHAAPVHSDLY